jgi:hypothetical protein
MEEVKDMSKEGKERKADLIDAYLRHVHEGGDVPDISVLPDKERREIEATFKMLDAIAGIPADLVPDLEDDPVAKALGFTPSPGAMGTASTTQVSPSESAVIAEIELLNREVSVLPDVEAAQIGGARSDLLLRVGGMRIRIAIIGPNELKDPKDLFVEGDRIFYRFPNTAAIAFVQSDDELLSQILEPRDCRPAVEAPGGVLVPPRPRRPVLPLRSALTGYLEDVEPIWDPPGSAGGTADDAASADEIAREVSSGIIRRLSEDGVNARTPAKQATWIPLGDREIEHLAQLIIDVHSGTLSISELASRQQEMVEDVA